MSFKGPGLRAAAFFSLLVLMAFGARQANLLDRHFIFFPERGLDGTPGDVGLAFEDVFFSTSDGVKLHGWFVPGSGDLTLLWFHGNAGNISHRIDNLSLLRRRLGVSVFIFDYRGYGRSEGKASEKGTYLDAQAALDYLRSRDDVGPDLERKLVLFGRSLGCAVAVQMATRHNVYAVILESAFTSIRAMAERAYPYVPVGVLILMVQARYDSLSKIGDVHSPLMVLHGDRDEIAPMELGRELFDAANEPKRFYTIEGAGHNDTYIVGGEAYLDALKAFVDDPVGGGG
jgi:fermentation-respiration switch protein FrsA (DUF1100 family)